MEFFDIAFLKDFVANLAATLLGVAVGIPVALWIDRFLSGRREAKESAKQGAIETQRKNQFLQMLFEALDKNLQLVQQMEQEVRPDYIIFYNVDTQLLESVSSIKYDLIDDLDFNRRLDSIRYELIHLHRKVELQLEIEYSVYKAMGNYMEKRTQLVGAITAHFPRIKQEISEALAIITTKLPRPEKN